VRHPRWAALVGVGVVLLLALGGWAALRGSGPGSTNGGSATRKSSISVVAEPASYAQGNYFFRVRITGYAETIRHGTYAGSAEVLFVYPVQGRHCGRDVYAETALQTAGQGYQYHVGPGKFSVELTTFASERIKGGHLCAYLAPVNFDVEDEGGVPLGPLSAKVDKRVAVHAGV
jgi:hypothetical protein